MRRKRFLVALAAVPVVAVVVVLALPAATRNAGDTVAFTIGSVPEGASVFAGNRELGVTPLALTLKRGERRALRFVKRDHIDEIHVLDADLHPRRTMTGWLKRWRRNGERLVVVRLQPAGAAGLQLTTEPTGASVILDGQRVGVTPFSRETMRPGRHTLRLEHPDCFVETAAVLLDAGETQRVHHVLKSKVVALYKKMIEKEPGNMLHHGDLVHYHVLRGEFAEAAGALRNGMGALKRADVTEAGRFYSEIIRIYTHYYSYPPETETSKIRPVCREVVEKAIAEGLGSQNLFRKYLRQMDTYDRANPPG